jgi:hypothetical protein
MDALRARAFMDILLGMDSRPLGSATADTRRPQDPAQRQDPAPAPGGPVAGMIPPGFARHGTLTIPEATLTRRADRPGELGGIGPGDPDPGANTWDRYQTGRQPSRYPAHQRTGPLPSQGR